SAIDKGSVSCSRFGESDPCTIHAPPARRRRCNGTLPTGNLCLRSSIGAILRRHGFIEATPADEKFSCPPVSTTQAVLRRFCRRVSVRTQHHYPLNEVVRKCA